MRVRRIVWALVFGLLATVALAWLGMFLPPGQAWYGPRGDPPIGMWKDSKNRIWNMRRGENAWHTVIEYSHLQVSGASVMLLTEDYEARKFDFRTLPRRLRPRSLDDLHMMVWYHQTGWPLPALRCSVHWERQISNANIIYTVRGGAQLPRDADFNPRALPLTPVWPGLALNILMLACAWLLAGWGIEATRRRWRTRRARCARCGYSVEGLPAGAPCPECGADRP